MEIKNILSDDLKKEYCVTVDALEYSGAINKRAVTLSKKVSVAGFRKGKVPLNLVKQQHGDAIRDEVVRDIINDSVDKIIADNNLKPAYRPSVEVMSFTDEAGLIFNVSVEELPLIEHIDLSQLTVDFPKVNVSDEEVNAVIDRILNQQKNSEVVLEDRVSVNGDIAVIDFEGFLDGEAFTGGKGSNYPLELGSGVFINGFEEQVVGKKVGDEFEVNVSFPETYHAANLSGKPVVFKVKVNELREVVPVEITDEFTKKFGVDSVEEFKEQIKKHQQLEYNIQARTNAKASLLSLIADKYKINLPEGLVNRELDDIVEQFETQKVRDAQSLGEEANKTSDEIRAEYKETAERRVLLGVILGDYGVKHNIKVTKKDLDDVVKEEALRNPMQTKKVFEYYEKNKDALVGLQHKIFEEKVVDHMMSIVNKNFKEITPEELYANKD